VFITDTLEGLKGLKGEMNPVALVDKLALEWKLQSHDDDSMLVLLQDDSAYRLHQETKRPILTKKVIEDVDDLRDFIASASRRAFQTCYLLARPDAAYIQRVLVDDIFE
jgi:hypothetical protein